ncbi:MAG: MFS transporter, partial [Clostridia bacterium]|nr:MFS transporter [Clostridia bacterium]
YVSAYLKELGLNSAQVGLITSLRSVLGIIAPIFWGMLCDRYKTVKKPFLVCLAITIVLFPSIPLTERVVFGAIGLAPWMTVFVRFFYRPLDYIMTNWIAQMRRVDPQMQYGKIKVFTSIGSATGSAIYAYLLGFFTIRIGFFGMGIMGVVVLLLAPKLPDIAPPDGMMRTSFRDMHLEKLVRDPRLVTFFLFVICSGIPACSATNFMAYLLDQIGAGDNILGVLSTIRSLGTIPLMYLSGRFMEKFGIRRVLIVTTLIFGLGDFFYAGAGSVMAVIGTGVCISLISGLRNAAQVVYADELAPPELRSTVQMLNSTMMAIATIISSTVGGYMIDNVGIRPYFVFSGGIALAALVGFIIANKALNKRDKNKQAQEQAA